jgi:hypothetical protein
MSDFAESLSRIRSAVEQFMQGSPDDFGLRICAELLEPIIAEVVGLSHLGETTSLAERDCQSRIEEAHKHNPPPR